MILFGTMLTLAIETSNPSAWTPRSRTRPGVALRWALDMGVGIIPRSANKAHMDHNLNSIDDFTFEPEYREAIADAMAAIDEAIGMKEEL